MNSCFKGANAVMRLTILGNNGPYPAPGGACSGYLVESDSGNTRILIDCGTGVLASLTKMLPAERLNAIVLSHLHFDHMSDMLPMRYYFQFHPLARPMNVFLPGAPADVRALMEDKQFDLWPMREATIGEMRLRFCRVRHPVPTYAISVECDGRRMVYTGDTNTEPALELFADGADLRLADAGLSSADYSENAPHLSTGLCGQLARDARAKQLVLTHLNPKYAPEALLDEARAFFPSAELAEIGDVRYL